MVETVETLGGGPRSGGSQASLGLFVGVAMLAGSAVSLALAPLALDGSYSWVDHTTSESAGQRVDGAWVARTGFVLFGLAIFGIADRRRFVWRQPATALHLLFGGCMVAVAAYSAKSWLPEVGFDPTEDLLHSIAASVMGFAFAFGVAGVAVELRRSGLGWRVLDGVAVAASVVVPLGMSAFGSVDGVLQRVMFTIAYVWYGRELFASRSTDSRSAQ